MRKVITILIFWFTITACQDDETLISNTEWTQISNWDQDSFARCIAVKGSTIFVGRDAEIFRSEDHGNTWKKLPQYT